MRRWWVLVVPVMLAGVACSDSSSGGSAAGSTAAAESTGVPGSEPDGTTDDSTDATDDATSTSAAGSTTTPATTVPPGPTTTDPFAPEPPADSGDPAGGDDGDDGLPGPPMDDCIDVPAGPGPAEMVFDDDRVRYGTVEVACLRVPANQALRVRSNASGDATVLIAGDVYTVNAGAAAVTPALGAVASVGDVFDVVIEQLDTSVVVQVMP